MKQLNDILETIFIQEMLKKGYLASTSVYLSYAHSSDIINKYMNSVDEVFYTIAKAIKKDNLLTILQTAEKEKGFKRLT